MPEQSRLHKQSLASWSIIILLFRASSYSGLYDWFQPRMRIGRAEIIICAAPMNGSSRGPQKLPLSSFQIRSGLHDPHGTGMPALFWLLFCSWASTRIFACCCERSRDFGAVDQTVGTMRSPKYRVQDEVRIVPSSPSSAVRGLRVVASLLVCDVQRDVRQDEVDSRLFYASVLQPYCQEQAN